MNKIFSYILGVFYLLSTTAGFGAEKFDILPDLPDPLAYAVPSAEAASVSGNTGSVALSASQSIGHEPSLISVVLSLAFVILLIYLTGILYTKLNKAGYNTLKKQQGDFAKSHVSVVSTTQLGNNKTLHVVELDGKRMLIGASASTIQLIKDLGSINNGDLEEGEYSHIEIPNIKIPKIEIPKIEIPSIGFAKLKTKAHKNIEEFSDNKIEKEAELETNSIEPENPDNIIDSLFAAQNHIEQDEISEKNEHAVDPEEYALYKKYLG